VAAAASSRSQIIAAKSGRGASGGVGEFSISLTCRDLRVLLQRRLRTYNLHETMRQPWRDCGSEDRKRSQQQRTSPATRFIQVETGFCAT